MDSAHRTLRQQLKALVGVEFVFEEFSELRHFAVDGVAPRVVAAPADAEETAKVVAFLAEAGLSMAARGGGTGMGFGHPPKRLDVLLLTSRLDRIQSLDRQNHLVTAGAGIRLDELEHRLAYGKLRLPVNPPSTDLATLGGVLACNASGPRRLRHGTMRERSVEIKLINARGQIISSAETRVPQEPGLDLTRLLIGSLGAVGIMAEATVRLEPLPEKLQALLAAFAELEPAMAAAEALLASGETPAFLELVGPEALRRMNPLPEGVELPQGRYVLAVAAEGAKSWVAERIAQDRDCLQRAGAESIADLDHGIEWELDYILQELYAEAEGVLLQLAVPPPSLTRLLGQVLSVHRGNDLRLSRMAHAGVGVAHLVLQPGEDRGWPPGLDRTIADLRALAQGLGGSAMVLNAPFAIKAELPIFGADSAETEVLRRLKREWDPQDLFNPGRIALP